MGLLNRRSFFSLALAPLALVSKAKAKKRITLTREDLLMTQTSRHGLCFNCEQIRPFSQLMSDGVLVPDELENITVGGAVWSWGGSPQAGFNARIHVCDMCLLAITHCATCGRKLGHYEGKPRLLRNGDQMHKRSWPYSWIDQDEMAKFGTCGQGMVVADCQACVKVRAQIADAMNFAAQYPKARLTL